MGTTAPHLIPARLGLCGSVLYLPDHIYTPGRRASGVPGYDTSARMVPSSLFGVELLRLPLSLLAWPAVMGFSTVLLALAHVLAANAGCDSLPSCGTCLANSGCGWCASSTSCMSIASDGTVEGTCSDFQGSQCVGGSRDSNSFRTLPSRARPCLSADSTQRRPA